METLTEKGPVSSPKSSPFGGIPRNWKPILATARQNRILEVPPSGGSLEIGNGKMYRARLRPTSVPPSGGSLEIGNSIYRKSIIRIFYCSPFGGIPRNWKRLPTVTVGSYWRRSSPFGGIPRKWKRSGTRRQRSFPGRCSPFGGIPRNWKPRASESDPGSFY